MRSRAYEIVFAGQAGAAVRAELEDCQITTSPDATTTLCVELPDQAALIGLLQRIDILRLEITHVLLLPRPAP